MFRLLQGHHQGGIPAYKGLGMTLYLRSNDYDLVEVETFRKNISDSYLLLTVLSVGSNTAQTKFYLSMSNPIEV
jgi:hypothetical protein